LFEMIGVSQGRELFKNAHFLQNSMKRGLSPRTAPRPAPAMKKPIRNAGELIATEKSAFNRAAGTPQAGGAYSIPSCSQPSIALGLFWHSGSRGNPRRLRYSLR
jgi:hypothetical protein